MPLASVPVRVCSKCLCTLDKPTLALRPGPDEESVSAAVFSGMAGVSALVAEVDGVGAESGLG